MSWKKAIAAGGLIAMACCLYLKAEGIAGALLFGFALSFVCLLELDLFTGKIGLLGSQKLPYLGILAANLAGCFAVCLLLLNSDPALQEAATACASRKAALPALSALIKGFFCGVLMFLAVAAWKRGFRAGVFLCVTVFILCGFEHSIADFAYMSLAGVWSWNLLWIVLGNTLGAVACRLMVEKEAVFEWRTLWSASKDQRL